MANLRNIRDQVSPSTPNTGGDASPGDAPVFGRNLDDADDMPPPLPPEIEIAPRSETERLYDDMADASLVLDERIQMVDKPASLDGKVVHTTELGLVVKGEAGLQYVPRQYFQDAVAFRDGASVHVRVADIDGALAASIVDRIERPAATQSAAASGIAGASVVKPVSDLAALRLRMEGFDPNELRSPDPAVSAAAQNELQGINAAIAAAPPADIKAAAELFAQRLAIVLQPAASQSAEQSEHAPAAATQQHAGMGGGGGLGGFNLTGRNLLMGGIASWAALAAGGGVGLAALAGGTVAFGGGSAAVEAFKQARESWGQQIERRRLSSTDVLAKQVNSIAADIERETAWLRSHGLEGIERAMKAQGATLGEVVRGMERGGPLEHLGLQFKGLMADPEFAARYGELDRKLDAFGTKAQRYVKAAHAANQDPEPLMDALSERVAKAVDSVPTEKDGRFGLVSEKISEIVDRIKAVVQQLVGRLAPGRG